MINLPTLTSVDFSGKRVIVRADLDFDPKDQENLRFTTLIPTLDLIKEKNGQIILMGHRGRPGGKFDESLSLKPFESYFQKWNARLLENLRFDPGEESNDVEFAKRLASNGDFYVNEAFGASHRAHASIVGIPKLLPHLAGNRFVEEVENLSKIFEDPKRPVITLISGIKDDKMGYIEKFLEFSDRILIGGRLPEYIYDSSVLHKNSKVLIADLLPDKEDITIHSMEKFESAVVGAGTIVVSGPIGKFEDEGHRQGTKRVLTAVSQVGAFKVAGGGDTTSAIDLLKLSDKFDWISVGGGAMLDFLANHTLPGIEALL
ncbi:MAG: phosphoglycerate kinase [Candidatus Woesebacteria bacterium]|nr:MAG: phosphoglycerate kinase [Candidatus Woesebacteria bacterium]